MCGGLSKKGREGGIEIGKEGLRKRRVEEEGRREEGKEGGREGATSCENSSSLLVHTPPTSLSPSTPFLPTSFPLSSPLLEAFMSIYNREYVIFTPTPPPPHLLLSSLPLPLPPSFLRGSLHLGVAYRCTGTSNNIPFHT